MQNLDSLIRQQRCAERRHRGFLHSLDPQRTVTLRELLFEPEAARRHLRAPWIQVDRLASRLAAMARFFDEMLIHERVPGWINMPLVFLQTTDAREDEMVFRRIAGEEPHWARQYEVLPRGVHYSHLKTNFHGRLMGMWRSRHRRIKPLMHFSSRGTPGRDQNGEWWRDKPCIVGFRIPDMAALLGVGNDVATDYLARVLVHDLGHGFLPGIAPEHEQFHHIQMLRAMGVEDGERVRGRGPWEELVHRECTDPFFFLEARKWIRRCRGVGVFSPMQQYALATFARWHTKRKRWSRLRRLWGITPSMSLAEQRRRVLEVLDRERETGFPGHTY